MAKKNIFYRLRISIAVLVGILSVAAFLGLFYSVKIFDLQFAALIQRVFIDFSIIALVLLLFILITTVIFGRLYCSTLCPLGLLQEFAGLFKKGVSGKQKNLPAKYIIAAVVFGTLAGGTAYILRLTEPYTYFGSAFTLAFLGIIAVIAILIVVFFKDRFFCTNICPVGTVLGLISKCSVNKIYIEKETCILCGKCEKICPAGCIDYKEKDITNETCIKCLNCLNICPKQSIKYGFDNKKIVEFSPQRRQFMLVASSIAVFAVAAKVGKVIKKALYEKFSDVILPPGALYEERFLNKCLNCNLCVKVCPTRIIKKADKNFCAVSIDYSKNFCKFDCVKCTEVCPAGALKRISLEEKQRLRIAMIAPPQEYFEGFDKCMEACPTDALVLTDGNPGFLPLRCIGCGACVAISNGHITIYGTARQVRT
ncbi:MAG: 4Fe-4S binding protein [Endomicrobia bacterium]|nr:4Fe-4S binding protein [Endomicrobiia bacterium]MCL2506258.1 4Fe-4S binding protein [Endomicrobiia bacterium]